MRRALYGSERLSALDLDSYLPDLIGPTEVLTDDYRKQLAKHLPARIEGIKLCPVRLSPGKVRRYKCALLSNRLPVDVGFQHVRKRIQPQLPLPQNDGHR